MWLCLCGYSQYDWKSCGLSELQTGSGSTGNGGGDGIHEVRAAFPLGMRGGVSGRASNSGKKSSAYLDVPMLVLLKSCKTET